MKTKALLPFVMALLLSLGACKTEPNTDAGIQPAVAELPASAAYQPARFETDDRAEKIRGVGPELQALIDKRAEEAHIPGIAYGVVVDGELVLASSTGVLDLDTELPATPASAFRIASMTKSFTAMAIVKLRDEGKLALSDPAEKYIPEMAGLEYLTSDSPPITIKNLLTMTAGFPEDNPWGDRQLDEPVEMLTGLMEAGVSFSNPPSFEFEYSNTGYALLGHIISQVSGQPYQEYIREQILLPLDMTHTYWEYDSVPSDLLAHGYRWENEEWKPEPILHDGSYGAMGGLITTIEDFSKYVSFHLSAWPPRSGEDSGPVKRSSLREMQRPRYPRLYPEGRDWNGEDCAVMSGYGFGLGSTTYCNGLRQVTHGGALPGFGSNYVFFPDYGVGLMAFGNRTYTSPWPLRDIYQLLFDQLDLQPRKLPVSDILQTRAAEVAEWVRSGDPETEARIMAENFFMDESRENRRASIQEALDQAGEIASVSAVEPDNQLRGTFHLEAANGRVVVFFTLTPEKDPKVQQLDVRFEPGEAD
ncbi:serine hydrolase [Robiginitalea sp. SC105]|uniref:serine hydrolase domain-containing protein n=1 Tax=Robiginitalea sp. SC105 TaxID=2762332 RepID=UPI00163A52BF|nr:serine hydrolase domain-containing protein [Robiginitalea sp. SC105]MBC2838304.1 beta-lactamase family protein [Robiginitalea sp. SC105]